MPLSESETTEAKEAFSLFDRTSSGKIEISELPTVLRSLGYIPSSKALAQMQLDADPTGTGYARLGDFLKQVEKAAAFAQESKQEMTRELYSINEGIRFLLKGQRKADDELVAIEDLKRVLTRTGEQLSEEEATELFRELQTFEGGKVKFSDFVRLLTSI